MRTRSKADALMSPQGEEAKPPNQRQSDSGEMVRSPQGEEAKPPNPNGTNGWSWVMRTPR
jgi:hypothetical protein